MLVSVFRVVERAGTALGYWYIVTMFSRVTLLVVVIVFFLCLLLSLIFFSSVLPQSSLRCVLAFILETQKNSYDIRKMI